MTLASHTTGASIFSYFPFSTSNIDMVKLVGHFSGVYFELNYSILIIHVYAQEPEIYPKQKNNDLKKIVIFLFWIEFRAPVV
jgi:hypothetical protein